MPEAASSTVLAETSATTILYLYVLLLPSDPNLTPFSQKDNFRDDLSLLKHNVEVVIRLMIFTATNVSHYVSL